MENEFHYKNDLSTYCLLNMRWQQIVLNFYNIWTSFTINFPWIGQGDFFYKLIFKII